MLINPNKINRKRRMIIQVWLLIMEEKHNNNNSSSNNNNINHKFRINNRKLKLKLKLSILKQVQNKVRNKFLKYSNNKFNKTSVITIFLMIQKESHKCM